MDTDAFSFKVLNLYRDEMPVTAGIMLNHAWILAPGIMLVHDLTDQYDVYFDPKRWAVIDSRIWPEDEIRQPDLIGTGLRVLDLIEYKHVTHLGLDEIILFVRQQIRPTANQLSVGFYLPPVLVDLAGSS